MSTVPGALPSTRQRRRIGEVLLEQGLLTEEQLQQALQHQSAGASGQPRQRLGSAVISMGMATERQVAEALAEALGLELVDLARTVLVPEQVRSVPRAVAERSGVIVLGRDGNRLHVAAADPTNVFALDDVKLYTRAVDLQVSVATESSIRDHLARAWSLAEDAANVNTLFEGLEDTASVDESDLPLSAVDAAPIVRLVDVILADAVRAGASDVHVEPQAGELRIRYRVDGLLRDVMTVPRSATSAATSRIKIVSGLDIAERRRPQDGRARLTVDGHVVEARVSTLPTLHGEKVVIRLLPRAENVPLLTRTGMTPEQLELVGTALLQSQGLILITGPTGSGKTNTLYASIQQVSTPDRNIVTLEDPVEVQVAGITQVQVNIKQGLTFAKGLRSVLRQDPDIVLVGEVRDSETAELALQASLTGHLVLTTLHTNDAVSAITRLVDMGVEPFLVASSLTMVVAQRLVRRPCTACAAEDVPSPRTLAQLGLRVEDLAGATPRRGKGCVDCAGTGYRGRTGIYEVLPVTSQMRQVLLTTPTEAAVGAAARAHGMLTLRASGLAAAHRGDTTYAEVLRATPADSVKVPRCPTCARALADDMQCCPWDGALLGDDRCVSCDRQLAADWGTCPWCRTAVATTGGAAPELPRVLVVDADPARCEALTAALAGTVDVTGVHSSDDALTLLATQTYEGVLLDQGLPDLPGLDVVRLLRSDPKTMALPLALLSAAPHEDLRDEAVLAGADDFLATPVEPDLLRRRVQSLVRRQSHTLLPLHA